MNGIIIYEGKYGATRQYAMWLGKILNLPVKKANGVQIDQLKEFDIVLLGSSVYVGKLKISGWVKKNLHVLISKKIFLFQVAAAPVSDVIKRNSFNTSSIPGILLQNCQVFFLPGKMVFKKLSWKDRFLLKVGAQLTKNPQVRKTMLTDFDEVRKENLDSLVVAVIKEMGISSGPALTKQLV